MKESLNRREFLRNATGAGIGLGLAGMIGSSAWAADVTPAAAAQVLDTAGAEKLGWKLAVHSYTYRMFPVIEAIEKTASCGIKFMSVSGSINYPTQKSVPTMSLSDSDFEAIEKKLEACGISKTFVNMGVVKPTTDEAKTRLIFEFARKHGIEVLVAEPEPDKGDTSLTKVMDITEKLAKEFNIKVAIHNHPKPSRYWSPETVLEAVKDRSPLLGSCADTGHMVRSGLDPVECLKKLEGRVIALHFKDLIPSEDKNGKKSFKDAPWGTGKSNTLGQMEELKRQGFKGAFCVEYETNWENSTPEIAQCAKWFYATCTELAKK